MGENAFNYRQTITSEKRKKNVSSSPFEPATKVKHIEGAFRYVKLDMQCRRIS
jgi:hypothetical protein